MHLIHVVELLPVAAWVQFRPEKPAHPDFLRPVDCAEYYLVVLAKRSLVYDDVYGGAKPLLLLHLKHASPASRVLLGGERLFEEALRQARDGEQKLGQPLSRLCGHGHYRNLFCKVSDAVESLGLEAHLGKLADNSIEKLVEPCLRIGPLVIYVREYAARCRSNRSLGRGLPAGDQVNLVRRDHEGRFELPQYPDALDCLRLESLVDIDYKYGDVGNRAAPLAQVRERLVPGRVYEEKAGYGEVDFRFRKKRGAGLLYVIDGYFGGSNVLRYSACLLFRNRGVAYGVQ